MSSPISCMELTTDGRCKPVKIKTSFSEKRRWPTGKTMTVKLTAGNGGTCTSEACTISASFLTCTKHCSPLQTTCRVMSVREEAMANGEDDKVKLTTDSKKGLPHLDIDFRSQILEKLLQQCLKNKR
ncbi:hypothetical protein SESBI_24918 [Sesbania bispinosa]|nr:hypothetical protein SESBI_24918 [Sesbania bispinosa]